MNDLKWSGAERKIARDVFEAALQHELAELLVALKDKAASLDKPDDMWAIEGWLAECRREVDAKYDFRYSQLPIVFGRLLREGRITEQQISGLARDKLAFIERVARV